MWVQVAIAYKRTLCQYFLTYNSSKRFFIIESESITIVNYLSYLSTHWVFTYPTQPYQALEPVSATNSWLRRLILLAENLTPQNFSNTL